MTGAEGLEALRAAIMVTDSLRAHADFVAQVRAQEPTAAEA